MSTDKQQEKARQAFAGRLRQALAELGYAPGEQARLQRLFGVSGQAVRKWIEGSSMPAPARMPHVATVLGVRRAWLQDGEGPMRPTVASAVDQVAEQDLRLTDAEVRLLARYRLLDARQREALDRILADLTGA